MDANRTCETCDYVSVEKGHGKEKAFFCRRFPPQMIVVPQMTLQGTQAIPAAAFPSVAQKAFCGEWKGGNASGGKVSV